MTAIYTFPSEPIVPTIELTRTADIRWSFIQSTVALRQC